MILPRHFPLPFEYPNAKASRNSPRSQKRRWRWWACTLPLLWKQLKTVPSLGSSVSELMVSAQGTGEQITADVRTEKQPQVNFSKKKKGGGGGERVGILRGKVCEFSKSQLSYLKRIPPLSQLHTSDCLENQHLHRNPHFTRQQPPFMHFILPSLWEGWSFTCCSLPTWYEKASRGDQKSLECGAVSDCGNWQSDRGSLNLQENLI